MAYSGDTEKKGLVGWIDDRFPLLETWNVHMAQYYAPKNFNIWYVFGVLAMVVLVNQLLTGIWLTMSYKPSAEDAFASVEYIMRDVEWGWLIRYMHSTGASAFFIVVYLHMFRALLYGSYKKPRELLWLVGMLIFLCLMAEAFFGYLLPWGQMSYWGAQVIISLFGAIPGIGEALTEWIRGDYFISDATLNRFFALHVIALPLVLVALVFVHIVALHKVGSNNPDGIEIKEKKDETGKPLDGIAFHPYYSVKDLAVIMVFIFFFALVVFYVPEGGGYFIEPPNFEPANMLKTPVHIVPVWYFTPFYSILRGVTIDIGPLNSKFLGVVAMFASIILLFLLPWLDKCAVKSIRYRGWQWKLAISLFAVAFIVLGYLGTLAPTAGRTLVVQFCMAIYFGFFIFMPWYTRREQTKPVPERVTTEESRIKKLLHHAHPRNPAE
jgi:ubiquinol-cytochrome c reductase cytochrome b subunit